MKLFFTCPVCQEKVYLAINAKTRQELSIRCGQSFHLQCTHCNTLCQVAPNAVVAEKSSLSAVLATTLGGGTIGSVAGPLGIGIGLLLGGLTARYIDITANKEVDYFNNS